MCPTGTFTECASAHSCMAAEDEFRANALHLFFFGFGVFPSVFANAADIILIIYEVCPKSNETVVIKTLLKNIEIY